jgi:Fe2+ or Zn2+ uptake regulation protein
MGVGQAVFFTMSLHLPFLVGFYAEVGQRFSAANKDESLLFILGVEANAMRYDTNLDEHHHFVCSACGNVYDVYLKKVTYEPDMDKSPLAEARIDAIELYLHGVCKDCLKGS